MIIEKLTDSALQILAPAKINLFLQVLNRREDGFHNINSLFQAVSLFDRLKFETRPEPGIDLKILNNRELSTGNDNLVVKAFQLMVERFSIKSGLNIELEKNIPVSAGLAGGSTDGAATIYACNKLFELRLDSGRMADLGAEIGSDIPFFFGSGQSLVRGRGEIVENWPVPADYHLVLVNPGIAISTAEAYARLKRGLTFSKEPFNLARCATVIELVKELERCGNDFEEVSVGFHPELGIILDGLLNNGALLARMSGSGPTLFGLFDKAPDLEQLRSRFSGDWHFCAVRPITYTHDGST
ncbi:MAG: 4-(cytidine 5'-diphospho)-2-C-methyl-D-erythritol kinase [bacterium]|nr:4-(cytidine 5'-diphospho)-2-C-methyl-D-erythritol kinase [bacterium]